MQLNYLPAINSALPSYSKTLFSGPLRHTLLNRKILPLLMEQLSHRVYLLNDGLISHLNFHLHCAMEGQITSILESLPHFLQSVQAPWQPHTCQHWKQNIFPRTSDNGLHL